MSSGCYFKVGINIPINYNKTEKSFTSYNNCHFEIK